MKLINMKQFEIWMEGFGSTGVHCKAQLIGLSDGESFNDAVKRYMANNANHGISENTRNRYTSDEYYIKRKSNWNVWGCNLYDNETDARKFCG